MANDEYNQINLNGKSYFNENNQVINSEYERNPNDRILSVFNFTDALCNMTINETDCINSMEDPYPYGAGPNEVLLKWISIVVPILFGIIVVVGFFGNALVVIVVFCNPQMRSTTNLLIINLAIADLLFITFCVPFTAWDYAFPYWPFGDAWCRIVQYLIVVCAYASIYTLVLMSLDRYLAVAHPIQSMSIRTERNAYYAIFIMWMTIFVACIPALITHGVFVDSFASSPYSVCIFLGQYNQSIFQVCFFLSSYVIPITIILILYMLMLKRLWFGAVPGGHMSVESVRSKRRVTRLVVVVVIIFAFCWCPIQIVLVLKSFDKYDVFNTTKLIIQITSHILGEFIYFTYFIYFIYFIYFTHFTNFIHFIHFVHFAHLTRFIYFIYLFNFFLKYFDKLMIESLLSLLINFKCDQ